MRNLNRVVGLPALLGAAAVTPLWCVVGTAAGALTNSRNAPRKDAPAPGKSAPKKPGPKKPAPAKPSDAVAPRVIWFDGLARIQGDFRFVQVASPGGLWQNDVTTDGKSHRMQVTVDNLPPAVQDLVKNAEIRISDISTPTDVSASQERSPGQRGEKPWNAMVRRYDEYANGTLLLKNVPGVGAVSEGDGEYSGKVLFHLSHTDLSNPSDFGVFRERQMAEQTWGAAALLTGYADLRAYRIPPTPEPGAPGTRKPPGAAPQPPGAAPQPGPGGRNRPDVPGGAQGAGTPGAATPKAGAPGAAQDQGDSDNPEDSVLVNARLLRGGREIVTFFEYPDPNPPAGIQRRVYQGALRLMRVEGPPVPTNGQANRQPSRPAPLRLSAAEDGVPKSRALTAGVGRPGASAP